MGISGSDNSQLSEDTRKFPATKTLQDEVDEGKRAYDAWEKPGWEEEAKIAANPKHPDYWALMHGWY